MLLQFCSSFERKAANSSGVPPRGICTNSFTFLRKSSLTVMALSAVDKRLTISGGVPVRAKIPFQE